jgi:hypothetical protein
MRNGASWIPPMTVFFGAAVLVSVLGGPLLLGLLVGAAAALVWRPLRRDPPWTARGRAAWRGRAAAVSIGARAGGQLLRLLRGVGQPSRDGPHPPYVRPVDPADARTAARFDAAFRVRCEVVTARMQVWHSTDTGRAYEVALRDGPASALPGDEGWLSFDGGRPKVRLEATVERLLN